MARIARRLPAHLAVLLALGCGASEPPPPLAAEPAGAAPRPGVAEVGRSAAGGSPGFVVWESNRSGAWRLWTSDLEGGQARQLTADERRRRHCCPHIAPDGSKVAYLSLPEGRDRYLDREAIGELRVVGPDGGGERALVDAARTYFEHRAVVWIDGQTLHYIAADGAVERLELASGRAVQVLAPTGLARRWLVDATGRWAATGRAAFAAVRGGRLAQETLLPGCQPYFSHDGRWGVWTAGSGGPIDRFDLASGEASTLLGKNDPLLPPGRGYLYFPMLSADSTLLAFAASDGEHDHFAADYDILAAEIDPATLEILGRPWIVAPSPAVDRFPDLWRAPLGLGRTVGLAPLALSLASPDGEAWDWALAGTESSAAVLARELVRPGVYPLTARSAGRVEHGVVIVEAPQAPPVLRAEWPARTDGLLWSWSAADSGPTTELLRAGRPVATAQPLDLAAGPVVATDSATRLVDGLRRTNQLALELVLTPPPLADPALAAIVAVGSDGGRENLLLGQRGARLVLRMRVGPKGSGAYEEVDLGTLAAGRRAHLAVSYSPGRTTVFVDGRQTLVSRDLRGYFFHWRPYPLTLGDRGLGGAPWRGRIEALAIYDRPLSAAEVAAGAELAIGAELASSRNRAP